MPRAARVAPGDTVYHVINRANGKLRLFKKDDDFLAFFRCVREALAKHPIRILGWCVMANHWHFVVWPEKDGDLSRFFGYLGLLHATRWQAAHGAAGTGHVYQGRFKSFMVQEDEHLQWVLRYVERNALRANLVKRAQDYRWSSLHAWSDRQSELRDLISVWPIRRPSDWTRWVNAPGTDSEREAIELSLKRDRPLGDEKWTLATAAKHGLQSTLRPRGRPVGWRKPKAGKTSTRRRRK